MKKRTICFLLLLVLLLSITAGCGAKKEPEPTPTPIIVYVTPEPTATPASAEPSAESPSAEPTVTPEPTATPSPTPAPTPAPSAPTLTKSPTDESVTEGGTCLFIARADNATGITWHFVSPDGKTDVQYDGISAYYSKLGVSGGKENSLRLSNIPADMNKWKVYCRFTNAAGSVDSATATVYVSAATPTPKPTDTPKPTTAPTEAPVTPAPTEPPAPEPEPEYGPETFSGSWYAVNGGRATMDVYEIGDASHYQVEINWGSSAWESSNWSFGGSFNDHAVLSYDNCTMTTTVYDDDGNAEETTDFSGGTGTLSYGDGVMVWKDNTSGESVTFGR